MDLVAIEAPATRVTLTREAPELLDALLRIVASGHGLQIVADQLIETLAQGLGLLASAVNQLFVEGQRHVHKHIICVHVIRVNTWL